MDSAFWAKYCDKTHLLCVNGPFAPSGVLIKALILHSGQQVSSY